MEEITPITPENQDVLLYIRTLKKEINELDDHFVVILLDEDGKKVGKMEFKKVKTKLCNRKLPVPQNYIPTKP